MDDQTKLATYQADPERYVIGENGSIFDRTVGRYVDMIASRNPHAITAANSREMLQRKKDIAEASQLRALARASGLDPDTLDMEQLMQGAGTALEKLLQHFYATFLKSANLRGMAESYRQIAAPMVGEIHDIRVPPPSQGTDEAAAHLLELLREALKPQAIDGTVTDTKGE
jgi:hypothetical protein